MYKKRLQSYLEIEFLCFYVKNVLVDAFSLTIEMQVGFSIRQYSRKMVVNFGRYSNSLKVCWDPIGMRKAQKMTI
jgi:hypothetical protein